MELEAKNLELFDRKHLQQDELKGFLKERLDNYLRLTQERALIPFGDISETANNLTVLLRNGLGDQLSSMEVQQVRDWLYKMHFALLEKSWEELASDSNLGQALAVDIQPGATEEEDSEALGRRMLHLWVNDKERKVRENKLREEFALDTQKKKFSGSFPAWWIKHAEQSDIADVEQFYNKIFMKEPFIEEASFSAQEIEALESLSDEPGSYAPYGAVKTKQPIAVGAPTSQGISERRAYRNGLIQLKILDQSYQRQHGHYVDIAWKIDKIAQTFKIKTNEYNLKDPENSLSAASAAAYQLQKLSEQGLGIKAPEVIERVEKVLEVVRHTKQESQMARLHNREEQMFEPEQVDKIYNQVFSTNPFKFSEETDSEIYQVSQRPDKEGVSREQFNQIEVEPMTINDFYTEVEKLPQVHLLEKAQQINIGSETVKVSFYSGDEAEITISDKQTYRIPETDFNHLLRRCTGLTHVANAHRVMEAIKYGKLLTPNEASRIKGDFVEDSLGLRERYLGFRDSVYLREKALYAAQALTLVFPEELAYEPGVMMTTRDAIEEGSTITGSIDFYAFPPKLIEDFRQKTLDSDDHINALDYMIHGSLDIKKAEYLIIDPVELVRRNAVSLAAAAGLPIPEGIDHFYPSPADAEMLRKKAISILLRQLLAACADSWQDIPIYIGRNEPLQNMGSVRAISTAEAVYRYAGLLKMAQKGLLDDYKVAE